MTRPDDQFCIVTTYAVGHRVLFMGREWECVVPCPGGGVAPGDSVERLASFRLKKSLFPFPSLAPVFKTVHPWEVVEG